MARPIKNGCDYFPHDVDLSSDEKIEGLEAIHGNDGYATYLKLLERIYRNGVSASVNGAETRRILARKCNVTIEKFNEIIETMVRLGLFDASEYEKGSLTGNGISKRMEFITRKRRRDRERQPVTGELSPSFRGENPAGTPESKVKESKVKQTPPRNRVAFEALWLEYPKKDGRKAAERRFLASVKTAEDWENIKKALKNYKNSSNVKRGFIKNGSTWFNGWEDWINPTEEMMVDMKGDGLIHTL